MKLWTMVLFAAATLLGACVGKVGDAPSGSGGSSSSGTGNNSGTGNSVSSGTGNSVVSGVGGNAGNGSVITGAAGNGVTFCATRGVAITSQVPRLSNEQYDSTDQRPAGRHDADGANGVQPSTILATDRLGGLTRLGWSSYKTVARPGRHAGHRRRDLEEEFMACTPTGDGKTCSARHHHQVRSQGVPPAAHDRRDRGLRQAIVKTADDHADGTHTEIAQTLLYAFLVSPSFLTRDRGGDDDRRRARGVRPTSHEVASRLSYMLWGSIPDDTLTAAADANQLIDARRRSCAGDRAW